MLKHTHSFFSFLFFLSFFSFNATYAQEPIKETPILLDLNVPVDDVDTEDIIQKPYIQIYQGEDNDTKNARMRAIIEKRKAEDKRFKAFVDNRNALKKKENNRIRARERQNAKERKKSEILKKKRDDFMKRIKRIQKVRSYQ